MSMSALEAQCQLVLMAAASSSVGIVVVTSNPVKARAALYTTRRKLGGVDYANLQVRVSPDHPERELWLIKSTAGSGFDTSAEA